MPMVGHTGSEARNIGTDEASNSIADHLRLIVDTIPAIAWRKLPGGQLISSTDVFGGRDGLGRDEYDCLKAA